MNKPISHSPSSLSAVPQHIAIIMDGNNRWARRSGVPGVLGHRAGVEAVRRALEACNARGIKTLTLFAFSSENWGRPEPEVRALLALFVRYLRGEVKKLNEDGIRLKFIGRRDRFSPNLQKLMHHGETLTANNTEVTLVLAMDYGGRWDVTQAVRTIADAVAAGTLKTEDISEHTVADELLSNQFPEPDLCIRTGGNQRLSNFLLWEFAYTEFVFSDTLWPDFNECDLDAALNDFCQRDRRFGLRESDGRGQQG